MKKKSFILIGTLLFSFLLIVVFAIVREQGEIAVDDKPPHRYKITFTEALSTKETKEFLIQYNVQLLHITYTAPGFSGSGLATDIKYIEEVEQNILQSWKSDASDRTLSEEKRSSAKRFLIWSKNNQLKVSAFEGIGFPEETLRKDLRVKHIEEY